MNDKLNFIRRMSRQGKYLRQAIAPGRRAWRGAAVGALLALGAILLTTAFSLFGHTAPTWFLIGAPLFVAAFLLVGGLLTLAWALIRRVPKSGESSVGPWQPMQGELTLGHRAPQPARVAMPQHSNPCSSRHSSSLGMICQVR